MPASLKRRIATGALWMLLFKAVERTIGIISTLILARLLLPADFGIVAMAIAFIAMAELLGAVGFDYALIQNRDATAAHYSSAWTGNVLLGLFIALLMLLAAAPVAGFYREPNVMWVVVALAFGPLISGCENIGVVEFRKTLDFRREFTFQLSRKAVGFAVTIPLALWLQNYWALVAGMLSSKVAGVIASYVMHPFRPRLSLDKFRELIRFSRWVLLNNAATFLKERMADFFVGRWFGPASLGVYSISYELATLPSTELSAPINRALLPGFASMQSSEEVASAYGNALGILALIALPAAAGIFAVAPYLIPVLLGAKWLDAVPLLEVLAFNGAIVVFHSSIAGVLFGRGFPKRVTTTNACYVAILAASLAVLSLSLGVIGAAYAVLLSSIVCTPIFLYQVKACLGIGPTVFIRAITRPLLAALGMAAIVRMVMPMPTGTMNAAVMIAWLCGGVAIGAGCYFILIAAGWLLAGRPGGPESTALATIRAYMIARSARSRA